MYSKFFQCHQSTTTKRILFGARNFNSKGYIRYQSNHTRVTIGNASKEVKSASHTEYIPQKYLISSNQTILKHLRWMIQKDHLGQDIFLIGAPGKRRRNLALAYVELTGQELEFIAISRDTTESDLKQRREIKNGTASYIDQNVVRAAIHGRILVIEGVEKAERNVLPILNNLLENREMNLEDGRFLMSSSRYDKLLENHSQEEMNSWKLVRVSEQFRVIALGLPTPRYPGHPLDPPLRSRFQARHISSPSYEEELNNFKQLAPNVESEKLSKLLSCAYALTSQESIALGLPDFPLDNLLLAVEILKNSPDLPLYEIFYRLYPYKLYLEKEGRDAVEGVLHKFKVLNDPSKTKGNKDISTINKTKSALFQVSSDKSYKNNFDDEFVQTDVQNTLIADMIDSFLVSDLCLIGPKGCGKTMTVNKLANLLNYDVEPIVLYQDMTSRDLLQQRTTGINGNTIWKNSPLVTAAIEGKLAILDGIHRIHPSTIAILHRLVHDRELQLYDGKRLIRADRYDSIKKESKKTDEEMHSSGVIKIHPSFKIIALAEPPVVNSKTDQWLNPEVLSLFLYHEMKPLNKSDEIHIIRSKFGEPSKSLLNIIELAHMLRSATDPTLQSLASSLSTRQLLRIAKRMNKFQTNDIYNVVQEACLARFLPLVAKQALEDCLRKLNIQPVRCFVDDKITCKLSDDLVTIGNTTIKRHHTENLTKVPDILFYDIPQHLRLLESLLQDFSLGNNILLIGNQGVGKNKIVDRMLQLLRKPREYIQLHRDTTVQTLTLQPTVKDGVVVYEDSPLVQAVKLGHALVVDEADKASTHVTCVLKTLIESGEMILSDGRRIVPLERAKSDPNIIPLHPDFRMIVLANRPGFPFLGNDFFAALGDLFSTHSVDNLSKTDEINLLKQYGPDVKNEIIYKLVDAFSELRDMSDQGLVAYPYSTREIANIVKHLQAYPEESLGDVVCNVFDFDRYNPEIYNILLKVLNKHGISITANFPYDKSWMSLEKWRKLIGNKEDRLNIIKEAISGLDVSGPKHGKVDEKNEPHVGGNTWAGGTGGRDTAGLGGKGGPYRLDAGHTVHQLSDAEKAAVPDHIKAAAREMGLRAFKQRLKDIKMSEYEHNVYMRFSDAVKNQVQALRIILGSLQAKHNEREWFRHQAYGELDDTKLIEGITGEKNIYKRRMDKIPDIGASFVKPKRLKIVVDVSGSMYRFNGYDGRLDREMEACVMVMEAFSGYEDKIQYDIVGHSGEEFNIPFVERTQPPSDNKMRLEVIKTMVAHSQFCMSGDHTLEAAQYAINSLAKEDSDESIVVIFSDANLDRYGIHPRELAKTLSSNPNVNAFAIFLGSLGDQAIRLTTRLPSGRAFVCLDLENIPHILKQIFTSSVLKTIR